MHICERCSVNLDKPANEVANGVNIDRRIRIHCSDLFIAFDVLSGEHLLIYSRDDDEDRSPSMVEVGASAE
jgi:hypothetical protein